MYGGDEVSALVVDVGTSCTKSGYAGEDNPKYVIPSTAGAMYASGDPSVVGNADKGVGEEADQELKAAAPAAAPASKKKTKYYVGTNALGLPRPGMQMASVMRDGLVKDWDAMEALWEHNYKTCLVCDPTEHPILVSEPSFNTNSCREKYVELLFEKFQVPALFVGKNAVMTAFAAGRGTAMVLDIGGGMTSAVPVNDGYVLHKPMRKSPLAGDALTEILQCSLKTRHPHVKVHPLYSLKRAEQSPGVFACEPQSFPNIHNSYHRYMALDVLRDVKESVCRVVEIPPEERHPAQVESWPHELPDRTTVDLDVERYNLPELLLNPQAYKTTFLKEDAMKVEKTEADGQSEWQKLIPESTNGISKMVFDAISACDPDTRRELYNSVVVTGGSSLFPGLTERLHKELSDMVPQMMSMKVKVIAPNTPAERRFSVWIGGSILASLGSFQQLWMSKGEYEEMGASAIHRKCP